MMEEEREDALDNELIVIFDMWGQRCETVFNGTSELSATEWLKIMVEKGWLLPIEILTTATVYSRDELEEMFKE